MGGGTAAAASLALVAGLAGSIQVAVMGRFGERIGSFEALAANLVFSTLIATAVLLVLRQSLAGFGDALRSPWWYWVGGGGMGVVVVLAITVVTPKIGAAATIGLLIAGQLAMGVAIDTLRPLRRRQGRAHLAAHSRRAAAGRRRPARAEALAPTVRRRRPADRP